MPTYIDLLPEEIIQLIWKYIYNDNLNQIPHSVIGLKGDTVLHITTSLIKRKGYYYDILKRDYNVVLFNRKFHYIYHAPQAYDWKYLRDRRLRANKGLTDSDFWQKNSLRGSEYYNKKVLREMLYENGYKLYYGTTRCGKAYYISWTRDRLIKELMSF